MGAAWKIAPDVERYDDALDWLGKRTVITGAAGKALDARLKSDAFWVGNGLQLTQVQRVFDRLTVAIERGDTFEDFRKSMLADLKDPVHAETVFRNASQRAYNAGRWAQMHETSTLKFRPFGLVDAILDDRTTAYCIEVNGTLLPLDDPWWLTHWFPAHHRCRTSVRNLRRPDAEKRGAKPGQQREGLDPAKGWGQAPGQADESWKPKRAEHDAQLWLDFSKRAEAGETHRKPQTKITATPVLDVARWSALYTERYGADVAKSLGHGRAAMELGLDMPVADVRAQLAKIDALGFKAMLDACEDAEAGRTLREQGGELDPLRKLAAAVGGHLRTLPGRAAITNSALKKSEIGRRSMAFFGGITGPSVMHPESWAFRKITGRASCSASKKRINYRFAAGVLEHEWGHAIESLNPSLAERARAFWVARTMGEAPKRLKALFPGQGYKADEITREDGFDHAYIGKDYGRHGTEITSMAIEALFAGKTSWGTIGRLAQKDIEHLLFLLGQLAGT